MTSCDELKCPICKTKMVIVKDTPLCPICDVEVIYDLQTPWTRKEEIDWVDNNSGVNKDGSK